MLKDKVAIITGGGKGIGKAITLSLIKSGARVVVVQRTELDDELKSLSGVEWVYGDLSSLSTIEHIAQFVGERYGELDIIVNNAGVMTERKLEDLQIAEWQETLAINTTFPLFLIKSLLPLMRGRGGGSIINIGSIEGISANPHHTAYCTSKAALHGMTRSLAVDLGAQGIRCNTIAPGWIDTELNKHFSASLPSGRNFQDELIKLHPAGRTGTPQDIANLVTFLASDQASFMTGQILIADGGRTAMLPMPS